MAISPCRFLYTKRYTNKGAKLFALSIAWLKRFSRVSHGTGPVPGLDTDLPEPEKVANAFGDNNLKVRIYM